MSSRRAYAAWIAVCLIWGTTYLGIRIALETLPPFLMAAARWIVAGTWILVVLKARGEQLPGRKSWGQLLVLGILFASHHRQRRRRLGGADDFERAGGGARVALSVLDGRRSKR